MGKTTNIRWTDKEKEIAALAKQGLDVSQITERGFTSSQVYEVLNALKRDEGWKPQRKKRKKRKKRGEEVKDPSPSTISPHLPEIPRDPAYETKYRIESSEPVTLGALQVLPEDWRISQHGVFLMLDTYYLTKAEIGYDGTMGKFIVDVFRLYRKFMQYAILSEVGPAISEQLKEGSSGNGTGEEASGGRGIPEKGSSGGAQEGERSEIPGPG